MSRYFLEIKKHYGRISSETAADELLYKSAGSNAHKNNQRKTTGVKIGKLIQTAKKLSVSIKATYADKINLFAKRILDKIFLPYLRQTAGYTIKAKMEQKMMIM